MRTILSALAIAVLPPAAWAGSYTPVALETSEISYLDLSSVKRDGDIARGWILIIELKTKMIEGQPLDFTQQQYFIKCRSDQIRFAAAALYVLPMNMTRHGETGDVWSAIIPDTTAADVERLSCTDALKTERTITVTPDELVVAMRQSAAKGELPKPR